jgi:hypothetical protein
VGRTRKTCIFCRQPGASEEHVFSRAVSRIVPGEGDFISGIRQHPTKVIDITNRATCVACNTGWMSDFEDRAIPLLIDPLQGRARTYSATEQIWLAAWAFKTACMLDCSWPGRVIPDRHYRYLFRFRTPPANVHIWVTSYRPTSGEAFHSVRGLRWGLDVSKQGMPGSGRRYTTGWSSQSVTSLLFL